MKKPLEKEETVLQDGIIETSVEPRNKLFSNIKGERQRF
jgi:hypothetical protein